MFLCRWSTLFDNTLSLVFTVCGWVHKYTVHQENHKFYSIFKSQLTCIPESSTFFFFLHLARTYARIFARGHYLFRKLSENFELWGTDNVQEQISWHIFAPNGGYCVYYPFNISQHVQFWKLEASTRIFPSFSWGIFSYVTLLDQSRAKIGSLRKWRCWIISSLWV